jgi:hypothetical protein
LIGGRLVYTRTSRSAATECDSPVDGCSHRQRSGVFDPLPSSAVFWSTDRSTLKADIAGHPPFVTKSQKLPVDET